MSIPDISDEIYGMPSFVILRVNDAAESREWYEETLGFKHIFTIPGPGGKPLLVHIRWAKYADLLLQQQEGPDRSTVKGKGMTLNFAVTTGSVDDLAERARKHGASIVSEPRDQPWNARDFSVADPDGFVLTFTRGPVNESPGIEDIRKQVRARAGGLSDESGRNLPE